MTQVSTTTTVETTTAVDQGTQLVVGTQSNTVTIGNYVTDVTVNPYIAPQIISFISSAMRPNQRVHAFFDSVLVDSYCAPGTLSSGDTANWQTVSRSANWGTALYTDNSGVICGQFNVPATTFKTGDRVFELADVDNIAQGNDAITTQSTANFTASNITVTKQAQTLTTVNPVISYAAISNTIITTNTQVSTLTLPDIVNIDAEYEPIAQGLSINTPNNEAGVFATSITLFFKQKPNLFSMHGIKVYICETNNGYPDGNKVLPFSSVHLPVSSVNTSDDSSVGTDFVFESPVFLANGLEYAFIVKPDNNDPDYFVFSANLGDVDLLTGNQMFSQPVIGTAFYGATTTEWTALQTEYLKFRLNIANFSSFSGDVYFNNGDNDYLTPYNLIYTNTSVSILHGDYVFQSTNSTVTTVDTTKHAIVKYYDSAKGVLYTETSTGNFSANSYLQVHRFANDSVYASPGPNTSTIIAWANTGSFYNFIIDSIVPQFATIAPAGTTLSYDFKGTSNGYTADTNSLTIVSGTETEFFDKERIIFSKSIEGTYMGGAKSANAHIKMTSDSILLSPVIDLVRSNGLAIGNQVDKVSDIYNEYYTNGGSKSKYISQIVTLAQGQDAQDFQVSITAHRPPNSDIKIYVKFLNGQDGDPISAKTWTPLLNNGFNLYSNPSNPSDTNAFTYTTYPYYPMQSTNGTITVANTSNTITGYSTKFGQSGDIQVGMWLNMVANSTFSEQSRQVTSITSNTSLTINTPFNGNYTTNAVFIAVPPTTAWASANTITQLAAPNGMFQNTINGSAITTVTANTTSNIITGSNSNFTALLPGQILGIGGYYQAIVSIANSTQLTVGTPWVSNFTAANGYIVAKNGLTYLNSNNNLFTTFKQFQIKMVLQSNDSSKIPLVNDITAMALQL